MENELMELLVDAVQCHDLALATSLLAGVPFEDLEWEDGLPLPADARAIAERLIAQEPE